MRPSEQEIRAKKQEIAIRYARSGYRPTIGDMRQAEYMRVRKDRQTSGGDLSFLDQILKNPTRLKAITAGRKLQLTYEERRRLNIKTIAPYDVSLAELRALQHEQKKLADKVRAEGKRRTSGARKRAEYEANSLSQTKPWLVMGLSRRSWYRKGKPIPPRTLAQVRR